MEASHRLLLSCCRFFENPTSELEPEQQSVVKNMSTLTDEPCDFG